MPIYIYQSMGVYAEAERRMGGYTTPSKVYGNCPFILDIEHQKLSITFNGEQVEEEYYSYSLYKDKILIFKEF